MFILGLNVDNIIIGAFQNWSAGEKITTNDKKAISILIKLLDKRLLNASEKEAVRSAIGILGWTSLSQGRIKALKAKRDKSVK